MIRRKATENVCRIPNVIKICRNLEDCQEGKGFDTEFLESLQMKSKQELMQTAQTANGQNSMQTVVEELEKMLVDDEK